MDIVILVAYLACVVFEFSFILNADYRDKGPSGFEWVVVVMFCVIAPLLIPLQVGGALGKISRRL